jgi:hypothetical protein
MQMAVRSKVQGMLGVEEKINIRMHVNKIMKGAQPEEAGDHEDMGGGPAHAPFREIE